MCSYTAVDSPIARLANAVEVSLLLRKSVPAQAIELEHYPCIAETPHSVQTACSCEISFGWAADLSTQGSVYIQIIETRSRVVLPAPDCPGGKQDKCSAPMPLGRGSPSLNPHPPHSDIMASYRHPRGADTGSKYPQPLPSYYPQGGQYSQPPAGPYGQPPAGQYSPYSATQYPPPAGQYPAPPPPSAGQYSAGQYSPAMYDDTPDPGATQNPPPRRTMNVSVNFVANQSVHVRLNANSPWMVGLVLAVLDAAEKKFGFEYEVSFQVGNRNITRRFPANSPHIRAI
ncbi:hypothetical protein C8F01DRAFT_221900 [Mycena amicta]|nr:hypothetical protein C8F01DRAFT_221900 [Mycena amicta]